MHSDVTKFFELIGEIRKKSIALSPQKLSPLLGVSPDRFEYVSDWLLKDARAESVSFELWLQQREGSRAANFWLSDARFSLEDCRQVLSSIFGPIEYVQAKKGAGGWISYRETEIVRQATFIFDGTEGELYLEMIIVS